METSYPRIVKAIRSEVAKYVDRDFADTDDFLREVGLLSDDLTAIGLAVERTLGIKLSARERKRVSNVETFAKALLNRA